MSDTQDGVPQCREGTLGYRLNGKACRKVSATPLLETLLGLCIGRPQKTAHEELTRPSQLARLLLGIPTSIIARLAVIPRHQEAEENQ